MKKVNFDSLTNLKAPERFIENALNIPNTQKKKKPIAFLKYSRTLAAVACLVIVSAVCLSVYLTQDRITPPIDPNYSVETQKGSEKENNGYIENGTDDTKSNKLPSSSKNNDLVIIFPTVKGTIEPFEKPSSVKPTQSNKNEPTIGPTKPTEGIEPSEKPTTRPTTKPTAKPTKPSDKPKPTIPQKPTKPDEIEPVDPTDGLPNYPYEPSLPSEGSGGSNYTFYTSLSLRFLDGSSTVECSVEDPNGNIVVSRDTAYVYATNNDLAYIYYELPYYAITKSGNYYCNFYSKDGTRICTSSIYVQV